MSIKLLIVVGIGYIVKIRNNFMCKNQKILDLINIYKNKVFAVIDVVISNCITISRDIKLSLLQKIEVSSINEILMSSIR